MRCFLFISLHTFFVEVVVFKSLTHFYIIVFQFTLYTFFIKVILKKIHIHKSHRITYSLNVILQSYMSMPLKKFVIKCIYIPSPTVLYNTFSLKNYPFIWFRIYFAPSPLIVLPYVVRFTQGLLMVLCQTNF